ncbi:endolytic transglycosylase MltG [Flavobacterium sp. MAH-1]|uniref:Endolytic murein transglycosylase n=1 Tax=Flavobacterium agri TaxID=2743471 RepID=A0A7Y8Y406_9FLAO|nr:endolytic transglycosylase MltG [Flavobacterium agri]NUY82093.1 endolytic transglycosylase MltG [Flavobacterium agri]NYA72117.1 endolytic transglycosylase MltG [Flavobacterium agri]
MNFKKIIGIVSVLVVTAAIVYGYILYRNIFSSNTKFEDKEIAVFIPTNSDFDQVKDIVRPYIEDMSKFESVAEKKSYITNIKAGKFIFKKGMNSNEIINSLRQPVPVHIAFNNQERLEDLAGRIGQQIEADSTSLMKAFLDPEFLKENGFTEDNVLSMFIPNSYEFFWNTNAEKFRDRMAKEYRNFWNGERTQKAEALGLTPLQVSALASIVHKETVKTDERPRVAGVYLNRLEKGMKLEADPTVIYAVKKNSGDWTQVIKRVLNKDLATVSPYNMYANNGLPPGPIAMPDITAIDAVLNPEKHNYIYFCASVTNFGYHEFAVTAAQHEVNRQKYVAWINSQGIKR